MGAAVTLEELLIQAYYLGTEPNKIEKLGGQVMTSCALSRHGSNTELSSDLAARLGGDEFAIVLVNTGMVAAATTAETLADGVAMPSHSVD